VIYGELLFVQPFGLKQKDAKGRRDVMGDEDGRSKKK
jgi:hypothetical protein